MTVDTTLFGRIQLQHLAVNNLIQWGDHLSVGHPAIDSQHKAIFDLGTKVYEHWRQGEEIGTLESTVEKLETLLKAHFAFEEAVLAKAGYQELEQHRAEHRGMLNDMATIRERFAALPKDAPPPGGSLLAPGWSIMQFFLGFTVGHVMSSDMKYCAALSAGSGGTKA